MPCIELKVTYSFDYTSFLSPELELKAQKTLSNFLGFVRQSFDALLEQGKALQEIYDECKALCPNAREVFNAWLASDDFGASCYIAQSAMEIFAWFERLQPKVQNLVRQNVQKWSVSALRQLTKVSTDLVKELVSTGKKTAAQVKNVARGNQAGKQTGKQVVHNWATSSSIASPVPELAPGVRIVVTGDDRGWNGYSGVIVSQWEENGPDSWWISLDYVQNQGCNTKHLFKSHQIKPEGTVSNIETNSTELFTLAQVEQKIAEALAQRDKEKAEEEVRRFVEIRDAALEAAKEELFAAQQHAQAMNQEKQELAQQLMVRERELEELRSLRTRNQQLEQRVADLENALEDSDVNRWENTFTQQAAKVVNSELEKTITPLMSEVDRLNGLLSQRSEELAQLQTINIKQQEELTALQQKSASKSSEIFAKFAEVGERLGWAGWSRRGYRANNGILHTGLNAISAFVSDLTQDYNYQQKIAL